MARFKSSDTQITSCEPLEMDKRRPIISPISVVFFCILNLQLYLIPSRFASNKRSKKFVCIHTSVCLCVVLVLGLDTRRRNHHHCRRRGDIKRSQRTWRWNSPICCYFLLLIRFIVMFDGESGRRCQERTHASKQADRQQMILSDHLPSVEKKIPAAAETRRKFEK